MEGAMMAGITMRVLLRALLLSLARLALGRVRNRAGKAEDGCCGLLLSQNPTKTEMKEDRCVSLRS